MEGFFSVDKFIPDVFNPEGFDHVIRQNFFKAVDSQVIQQPVPGRT